MKPKEKSGKQKAENNIVIISHIVYCWLVIRCQLEDSPISKISNDENVVECWTISWILSQPSLDEFRVENFAYASVTIVRSTSSKLFSHLFLQTLFNWSVSKMNWATYREN